MIKETINHLALAFLLLILISCSNKSPQDLSGFLSESNNVSPIFNSYSGIRPPISIDPSINDKIIIYQHETFNPRITPNCYMHRNLIPEVILKLQDSNTHIYFLCSNATDSRFDRNDGGNYIYRRVEELRTILEELRAAGVSPDNIYLAGYSAGAWTSLMANSLIEERLFNGIIGLAPAFAGRRKSREHSKLRSRVRTDQISKIMESHNLNALIFAYDYDEFENSSDLNFLTNNPNWNLTFVTFDCKEGHKTPRSKCKEEETLEIMKEYIGISFHADTTNSKKFQ